MDKILKKIKKISKVVEGGVNGYNTMKGRNSRQEVFHCEFGNNNVNTFIKGGSLDSGSHQGACGMRKDNKRVYCCQQCYPNIV